MEITDEEYNLYSPFFAYLNQKSEDQQRSILERFSHLSEKEYLALINIETAQLLLDLTQQQIIPATHTKAIAVLIAVVILGDAEPEQIGPLLEKIGLAHEVTSRISSALQPILAPVLQARILAKMRPLPPLTPSSVPANRNIIDLRKQP